MIYALSKKSESIYANEENVNNIMSAKIHVYTSVLQTRFIDIHTVQST